jgi:putative oxidoreductase
LIWSLHSSHHAIHQPALFLNRPPFHMQTTTTASSHYAPSARRSLLQAFIRTDSSWVPTIARVALGAAMLPHGLQKTLGWFGGYGFTNTLNWFTGTMHVPVLLGIAAIVAESLGAVALIAGFATRAAALGVAAVYVTAIAMVHGSNGFFMNWSGAQKGEGIEYFILGLALVAIVLIQGGGAASVDGLLTRKSHVRTSTS